eukprot:TRINITY_DN870_c0_g1_i2.p1 TRINITY_DN870_c0_g1~~TRINITY_DN870_c0_g1_i2.p1  ORF type:complete len:140 (-),score=26.30 TRINITY_DN870_c0_g1_i2:139-558(-)
MVTFAVLHLESNKIVGRLSYMNIVPVMRTIEIGNIWYGSEVRRSPVNTESCYLLIKHAIEHLGYRRVEWKCNSLNAPSIAAAIRLGFTMEGIFRQHYIIKNQNRDSAWFSLLDREWPEKKLSLEDKLYGDFYQRRPHSS